jgi:hypothetical protein
VVKQRSPVLGYNTNLRYRGLVFHVQTEDSGVANPHIFTHLFYEGTIVATRKTVYDAASDVDMVKSLMQAQQKAMLKELKKQQHDDKIDKVLAGTPGLLPRGVVEEAPAPASKPVAEPVAAPTPPPPAPGPPPPPPPAPRTTKPVISPNRSPTPHAGVITSRSSVIVGTPSRTVSGRQAAVTVQATGPLSVLLDRFIPVLQPKLLGLADVLGALGPTVRALAAGLDRRPADLAALPAILDTVSRMSGDAMFNAHVQLIRAIGDGRGASESDVLAAMWSVSAVLEKLIQR